MKYLLLTKGWNADPNAPEVQLKVEGYNVVLEFYLNSFIYPFKEDQRGRLTLLDCYKFSFNSMNDEGYYAGQYRYNYEELPWGEFYELETDWEDDFPKKPEILNPNPDKLKLKHYIFFLRDNTFECVAENYSFEIINP
jgi:hypothetical protein